MNEVSRLMLMQAGMANGIISCLKAIHQSDNDGNLPNWEEGEIISINNWAIPKCYITREVGGHGDSEYKTYKKQHISQYEVRKGDKLYFICGDNEEVCWTDLPTDELFDVYRTLVNFLL